MKRMLMLAAALIVTPAMAQPSPEALREAAAEDYRLCVMVQSSRHYDPETFPVEIVRVATGDCMDEMTTYLQAARQAPPSNGSRLYQIAFYEALQEVIHLRLTELR